MTERRISLPVDETTVRELRAGDTVHLTGEVHIFRDRAFDRALELRARGERLPIKLQGSAHWHCGPIVKKARGEWKIVSAGSTSSMRMNDEEPIAIAEWGVRLVIGKGLGMGPAVIEAMRKTGAAYLSSVGGCASYYAKKVVKVKQVHWLDLGMPEALWVVEVLDLGPLEVSIDSQGTNLYDAVKQRADTNLVEVFRRLGTPKDSPLHTSSWHPGASRKSKCLFHLTLDSFRF